MKTILFAGADATERGLLQYARRATGSDLNILFERTAPETIAYLNGDRGFADRQRYPLPDILVIDLTNPRMDAWEVVDWLKARPELNQTHTCFIGTEEDEAAVSKARPHGPCFFPKPDDAESYLDMIDTLAAMKTSAPKLSSVEH